MGYHVNPPSELYYCTIFYTSCIFIFMQKNLRDGVVRFLVDFAILITQYSIHREAVYKYKFYGGETQLPFENQCKNKKPNQTKRLFCSQKIVSAAFSSMAPSKTFSTNSILAFVSNCNEILFIPDKTVNIRNLRNQPVFSIGLLNCNLGIVPRRCCEWLEGKKAEDMQKRGLFHWILILVLFLVKYLTPFEDSLGFNAFIYIGLLGN